MDFPAVWTLIVIVGMVVALGRSWGTMEFVLSTALTFLLIPGIITPKEALAGFSNEGLITVALLFVLSEAIRNTGALDSAVFNFLGIYHRRPNLSLLMLKMMAPIAGLSAFLNNTAIVAIFTPIIKKWTRNSNLPASKFFIPLSFATVLGGCITLIGTSTNLVVHGLMINNGMHGMQFFELAKVGIPVTIVGLLYIAFVGRHLLPDRQGVSEFVTEHSREYVIEMRVKKGCPLVGKNVKNAGLRNLKGLFLVDIEREGKSLGPVSSTQVLEAEDCLMFAGVTSAVLDLQEIPGLVPADEMFERDFSKMRAHLVEAVVSHGSPILGKTVKECHFRGKYGAGVVAIHRNGERIQSKIGDITLRAGDTLLLFAPEDFLSSWKDSTDFYLMSYLKDIAPGGGLKSFIVLGVTLLMVIGAVLGEMGYFSIGGQKVGILQMAFAAVIATLMCGALPGAEAKKAMRWDVLITIACSFGISFAMQKTGLAAMIAGGVVSVAQPLGLVGILAAIYLLTNFLTEIMTNNSAAALIFPIALATAHKMGVSPMPFVMAVTFAASWGFSTPLGYQTHLMVQAAGGYKFSDYLKVGPVLNLICFLFSIALIPVFWKF